jgi:uncharacterized protein GlcG (DUF336 family)
LRICYECGTIGAIKNIDVFFFIKESSISKENLGVSMSVEIARRILEASKQRARELRSPVSIAIVDAGGHLVLFERMMAPYGWATGNISIAKACTAVMFNQSTDSVAQWASGIPGFASSMATMTDGKFIMAAGGWPIRMGGATIGGIGVSGGNAPGRDDEIARAGLSVAEAMAPSAPVQSAQAAASSVFSAPSMQQPVSKAQNEFPRPAASTQNLSSGLEDSYGDEDFNEFNKDRLGGQ